jgi:hypothetical protein
MNSKQETPFRIGGVYRQRNGELVRLTADRIAVYLSDGFQYGSRSLANGADENALLIDPECGDRSLIPGELTPTASGWVALGAEKQEEECIAGPDATLEQVMDAVAEMHVESQQRKVEPTSAASEDEVDPRFAAAHYQDGRDLAMIARDEPKTFRLPKPPTFVLRAEQAAPATAKPNPFQNYTAPDCESGPSDHLNASRHQMAGMKG